MSKYSSYDQMKDSGIEWLGEIPEHWEITKLKNYADFMTGHPFDSDKFNKQEGIPLVRIRDIISGSSQTYYNGEKIEEAIINNGDVLIGMDGDFNICWWNDGEALLNQRVCCVYTKSSLDKRYLYYLLPFPLKLINDLTYYTTVKHLSLNQIEKIKLSYPPLKEQQAIADFLDQETGRIEELIEKKEKLIELLEEKNRLQLVRL